MTESAELSPAELAEVKLRQIERQNQELEQRLPKTPLVNFNVNRFGPLMFAVAFGLGGLLFVFNSMAAPAVQPSPGSLIAEVPSNIAAGQVTTVNVWADSIDQPVDKIQVHLMYPENSLEFVAVDTAGSAFEVDEATEHSTGRVYIARRVGDGRPLSGRQLVARLTFRAKQTHSATLGFSHESRLFRAGDHLNLLTLDKPTNK